MRRSLRSLGRGLRLSSAAVLLACACGKAEDPQPAEPAEPITREPFETPECAAAATATWCSDDPSVMGCRGVAGYDFLQAVVDFDEASSAAISVPELGTICVSGTLGATGTFGGMVSYPFVNLYLLLSLRDDSGTCVMSAFDAQALDIATVRFDLDRRPESRMGLGAAVIRQAQCEEPWLCTDGGIYTWLAPDRQELGVVGPGTTEARLDEFVGDDLPEPLSAYWLHDVELWMDASPKELPFEYCMSNFQLLDSVGNVVLPAPVE
jgi:hypothetical protein